MPLVEQQHQQRAEPSAAAAEPQQDVGAVVSKAKKAAQSLWMILHAQNCRLGPDRCPHRGCPSTKRLLLHIKTCSVSPGFGCTEKGCDAARKLMSHYKRCRDVRARQAASAQVQHQTKPHVCLVCSLMARHAKSQLLDGSSNHKKKVGVTEVSKTERWRARIQQQQQQQQQSTKSVSFSFDGNSSSMIQKGGGKSPIRTSHSFDGMKSFEQSDIINLPTTATATTTTTVIPRPAVGLARSTSSQMMPPPPPRRPARAKGSNNNHHNNNIPSEISRQLSTSAPLQPSTFTSQVSTSPSTATMFEAPPSQNVLMQQRIETVAASIAAPPPISAVEASALGKSYDSSCSYFPNSMIIRHDRQEQASSESTSTSSNARRERSDSFHFSGLSLRDDVTMSTTSCPNLGAPASNNQTTTKMLGFSTQRRSASCHELASLCETIREEEDEADSEGGVFEMTDDA